MLIDRLLGSTRFWSPEGEGGGTPEPVVVAEPKVESTAEPVAEPKPEVKAVEAEPKPKLPPEEYRARELERRVAKLTAQKKELEAKVAAQAAPSAPEPVVLDEAKIDALAEAKANVKAAQRAFDEACNAAFKIGTETYPEVFSKRVDNLKTLIDPSDAASQSRYDAFISAMIETDEAPKLIAELGADLEEAERIMKLSPVRQGIELAKLAARDPEQVSKVPKPITPIGTRTGSHEKIDPKDATRADALSTKEWMARRNAEIVERRKAGERVY